jgi:hypothetical protein
MKRHGKHKRPAEPKHDESKTMKVPKAGKIYFGLDRDASYAAAKNGQIPVIWVGKRALAIIPAIERMLEEGKTKPAA